jgi:hypothetical protein
MTSRRQSRDPLERYYSDWRFVGPLATWLHRVANGNEPGTPDGTAAARRALDQGSMAVEPCVGRGDLIAGSIRFGLRHPRAPWRTVDIDPQARAAMWHGDWTLEHGLWRPRRDAIAGLDGRLQGDLEATTLVITNPPFSHAIPIVEASWRRCPNAVVAILQRQTWHEPTKHRAQFFIDHPPDVVIIGRCAFLDVEGRPVRAKDGKPGGGDHSSCAWFVWGPNGRGLTNGLTRLIPWRSLQDRPVRRRRDLRAA